MSSCLNYTVFLPSHFFRKLLRQIGTDWDEILQGDVGSTVMWHAPLQICGALRQTDAKWRRKIAFFKLFVSKTPLPGGRLGEI